MDVETPAGGRDRTEGFAPEKRRTFHRGTLSRALPRGVVPFPLERWPWKAQNVTQDAHDVIQHYGRFGETIMAVWHVWQIGEAQGGLTFCSRRLHLP
jgi:hypothetical protein